MRILHMIPDIGIANGIMSVVVNFAKSMPEDIKFDIVYFHDTQNTRKEDIEALGGRVYKINKPSPKDLISDPLNSFFTEHKNEWSALHIHAPHFAVFIAPAANRAGIKKICVHCHSSEFSLKGNSKRNQLFSLYAKYFIKDKFACSRLSGDFWYGNKPYTVINNAIDCSAFLFSNSVREKVRTEFEFNDKFVIGHIGRTDIPQKNHSFLMNTFAEVLKLKPSSALLLMGAEETDELIKLCEELNITDKVYFLGLRNDVNELLQACDVFLFPSTREGLPVSIIEAQASGLPVLMSDTVSQEAVVTDLVRTKSLTRTPFEWAQECVNLTNAERIDNLTEMKNAGWDLSCVADALTKYYKE